MIGGSTSNAFISRHSCVCGCASCHFGHSCHGSGSTNTGAAGRSVAAGRRDPEAADARAEGRQEEIRSQEEVCLAGAAASGRAVARARDPETINPNSVYGSPASAGAAERAYESAITPVNPTQLIPTNLQGFSSSATHVTAQDIAERQPNNVNEALTRVPGVIVINDDGNAHHGGIGLRGSPPRRSRKMLVMEDGHTVNMALWLDPSVHYWAPIERMESIEVIRGTVITHGPNNNFGVLNSRNLSPFGPNETVISSAIGFTEQPSAGAFTPIDEIDSRCGWQPDHRLTDRHAVHGKSDTDISARWHVHTRQSVDNVGLVASYTGADVQGAWDTERLRVNDFYGALGFKGSSSDLVVSAIHARQRDNYDEQNFLGGYEFEN